VNLNVRNLPATVHAALRVRAAKARRSMEAEARAILAEACGVDAATMTALGLVTWAEKLYEGRKPTGVVDDLVAERCRDAEAGK